MDNKKEVAVIDIGDDFPQEVSAADAARQLIYLRNQAGDVAGRIETLTKDFIKSKFLSGAVVDNLCKEAEWGTMSDVMEKVAAASGYSVRDLYNMRAFYKYPDFEARLHKDRVTKFFRWMEEIIMDKGTISWRYCIGATRKALRGKSPEDAEMALSEELSRIENMGQRLEQQIGDLQKELDALFEEGYNTTEGEGVVAHIQNIIADAKVALSRITLPLHSDSFTEEAVESDVAYEEYVASFCCVVCKSQPVKVHRMPSATAETAAYSLLPMCGSCIKEMEAEVDPYDFWFERATNPWFFAFALVLGYYEGTSVPMMKMDTERVLAET